MSTNSYSLSPFAHLEIPKALAQILTDLHLDISFGNSVLAKPLASKAVS